MLCLSMSVSIFVLIKCMNYIFKVNAFHYKFYLLKSRQKKDALVPDRSSHQLPKRSPPRWGKWSLTPVWCSEAVAGSKKWSDKGRHVEMLEVIGANNFAFQERTLTTAMLTPEG